VLEERGLVSTIRMFPVQEVLDNFRAVHTERSDPGKPVALGQVGASSRQLYHRGVV
jgi:hypothetical protein